MRPPALQNNGPGRESWREKGAAEMRFMDAGELNSIRGKDHIVIGGC